MHRDCVGAAWLQPGVSDPEVRTVPHKPKAFHRLGRQLLAHGPRQGHPERQAGGDEGNGQESAHTANSPWVKLMAEATVWITTTPSTIKA
jgi:hypothetical protein